MYEEVRYAKPFLREVVVRVDFVAALPGLEKSLPPKLANEVSVEFPISEPVDTIARELQLSGEGVQQRETRSKQWNFFGKDREKQLALAPTFMFISYRQYTTFEDMESQYSSVARALGRAFPEAKASRFGLRYVNVIENPDLPNPTSWGDYFSPELLGTIGFFRKPDNLTRLINIAELRSGDIDLRFQFGMPNPDYPAVMRRPQFVLDLDGYVQNAHDLGDSIKYMAEAHAEIQNLFEDSITDKLRGLMNVKPALSVRQ
jgi:uncharacterized protein (TIGR04255 family)